jgi:hypothetical protein
MGILMSIITLEKEASGLSLLSGLHGVQKVGSSNLPAPTIASTKAVATIVGICGRGDGGDPVSL